MLNKKRIISFVLAIVMIVTIAPRSAMKASASFAGALQFDTEGKFTVMQIADVQVSSGLFINSRVINLLKNAIARYHPDLCVFTGDNQTGTSVLYKGAIDKIIAPMTDTNTKFAVTFGNHDDEGGVSKQTQYDYYKSKGGNNFIDHDVSSLNGVGSGAIPIYPNGQTSGTPAFQVYLMDSGSDASSGYDCPYTDQVDYYIQRSITYPDVPSLWYMHIIVPDVFYETLTTTNNDTQGQSGNGSAFGSQTWYLQTNRINWAKSSMGTTIPDIYKELPCPANESTYKSTAHRSSANYGSKTLYESWVAYGNMLGTYYGHDHKNSFVTTTDDGIDIGYGKAPTLESYNDGNPGCRIYELDAANGTYNTFNVTESDLAKTNINFNANGGTGFMLGQLVNQNSNVTLNANTYTRAGYIFAGWATSAGGSVAYANGANYSIGTSDVTLYAKWTASNISYITFDANGGSGGTGPTARSPGAVLTAPAVTKSGYTFSGWLPVVPAAVPAVDTTYTAQWTANTYTVSYNSNGGTGSTAASSHTFGISANLTLNGFTKDGNSFLGWSTDPDAATASYTNGQSVVSLSPNAGAVITLYAVWSPNQYTITFNANGGTGGGSSLMTFGTALTAPIVSKTGYTFMGWSPEVPVTVPAENKTYTAQWNLNQVSITFNANGGIGGDGPTSMVPGAVLQAPTVTRPGYAFIGWTPLVPATVPAVDTIYTAQWDLIKVLITFNANGGSGGTEPTAMAPGTALTAPSVAREGYTLTGWLPSVPDTVPDMNSTYTAQWNINNYTVIFDANGGIGGSSTVLQYGEPVTGIPYVTREGYTFTGWLPLPDKVPAENITYKAQWSINSYTMTFDANGGTGTTSVLLPYGSVLSAPIVTNTGFAFSGWTPLVPTTVPAENSVYIAQWKVEKYVITFDANGGTGSTSGSYTYGDLLSAPEVVRTGYTFAGWSPELPSTVPAAITTFTAKWNINSYKITFEAAGGLGGTSETYIYGSPLTAPILTRFGYVFTGWAPGIPAAVPAANTTYTAQWVPGKFVITFDANGGTGGTSASMSYNSTITAPIVARFGYALTGWLPELPSTVPAANTTYKAVWTPLNFTITFNAGGGVGGTSALMAYESALSIPAVSRDGFTFAGWSPAAPATVPAANTTYTALWNPKSYIIAFDASGGTGGTVGTMLCGSTLSAPAVSRTGYTFAGWSPAVPATVPAGNTTYAAQWNPNRYIIIFDANNGIGSTSGEQLCGASLSVPNVTKEGYTLTGWLPELPVTVPAENSTYKAQWSINNYQITFNADGGAGGTSVSLAYGSSFSAPPVAKTGYTFAGWSPDVPATVPAENITYTALWNVKSYTVTFNANGGVGGTSFTLAYGSTITAPSVTKSGYTLTGWSPVMPLTMPAQTLQLTAVWVPALYDAIFMVDSQEYKKIPTSFGSPVSQPADPEKPGNLFLGWDPGLPSSMPNQNLTFNAVWYPFSFTVSFNLNGGSGTVPVSQTAPCGESIDLPEKGNLAKNNYIFLGWSTNPNAEIPLGIFFVPADDAMLYAVWGTRPVLIPKGGSAITIEGSNNFISGLEAGLSKDDFESGFINIVGNARLIYTFSNGYFGTGTKVELVDNITNEVLQTYCIVIFGDVNGDGNIDTGDVGRLSDIANYAFAQFNINEGDAFFKAADIFCDGVIDENDVVVMADVSKNIRQINQNNGETFPI